MTIHGRTTRINTHSPERCALTAFAQDAEDNKNFQQTKLSMPVLAVGGEKSFGSTEAAVTRNVATNLREVAQDFLSERIPAAAPSIR
jgi:hypothetical protein